MSTILPDDVRPNPSERPERPERDGLMRRATDRTTARRTATRGPHPAARGRGVSLIVPVRRDADEVPWVFEQIPRCVDEVILVDVTEPVGATGAAAPDDHATGTADDATGTGTGDLTTGTTVTEDGRAADDPDAAAGRHRRPVVRRVRQSAPGKGSALRAGFAAATGEYVVTMDADGSMWPGEIPHYLHFLDNGYDFVKGSRRIAGGGSLDLGRVRSLGHRAMVVLTNHLYRTSMTDLCYGFYAFRRAVLNALDLRSSGSEIETEMIAHALRAGLRIAEVPSLELPRRSGRSRRQAVSDGTAALRVLVTERPGAKAAVTAAAGER
ncbi:glycosyltransferase family 2 protein [Kitasatospora sp. NPDC127111]|uniref:glycosyltransferase family 2 protein n=1 Tax=Kitasatospora sp. NPDC127111 TaxID=3345363 RepID=UPI00363C7EAB